MVEHLQDKIQLCSQPCKLFDSIKKSLYNTVEINDSLYLTYTDIPKETEHHGAPIII